MADASKFETGPGPDAADWRAPDETTKPPEKKPEAKGVFKAFQRFGRSSVGRALELATAGIIGISGADLFVSKMTARKAWDEFRSKHPEQTEIHYPTMAEVPEHDREDIMKERDNQYADRVRDGLKDYIQRNHLRATTPELLHTLHVRVHGFQESLEKFRPSVYDRELTKAGMGRMIRTDRPFPVVRFINLSDAVRGEVGWGDGNVPDTIFIDTDPSNALDALEVMEHEYLHTTQVGVVDGQRMWYSTGTDPRGKLNDGREYRKFNEGGNEYLRGKLNAMLERDFHPAYAPEVATVRDIEQTLGPKKFWNHYAQGQYDDIEHAFNRRMGKQKFAQVFDTTERIQTASTRPSTEHE